MRQPGLKQLVQAAKDPVGALNGLGPRRAVIQCRRHPGWLTVAEVRDDVLVVARVRHDLIRSSYDIRVHCLQCPAETAWHVLDLVKIRAALARPHRGPLKLDVEDVSRAPRDSP